MRTNRSNPIALLAGLALAISAAACVESEDEFWDDEDVGTSTSELVVPSGMVAFAPTESSSEILNPERGLYTGYKLHLAGDATSVRNGGYTLALALVDLDAYTSSSLPSSFLTTLNAGFAKARSAGVKLIVRFNYGDRGDASKSRILGHIDQLKTVLRDNANVIAQVQAGFIGNYGEWHSSTNGNDNTTTRNEVIAALLSAVPSSRTVAVRKPSFKNAFRAGALTSTEAFSGSSRSRVAHHNDCFLASESDLGTYDSPVSTWKNYVAADSAYAPMGGETCKVYTARTNCTTALSEMKAQHWTYLNKAHNVDVLAGWVEEGCFNTAKKYLGYRFVLTRVAHVPQVRPGGVLALELDIRNRGYAVPMNQRPIEVVLTRGSTRKVARLSLDARRLTANTTTTVAAELRVPANLPAGTYTVSLRMPDASSRLASDPRYAIQLANSGTWDGATGDNVLTRDLVISTSAPTTFGAVSSSTTFAELP